MDDDRLSTTSDCSLSHQLNDLGDVQHVARIQEAALMRPVPPLPPAQQPQQLPTPSSSSSSSAPQNHHDKRLLSPDSNPPTHYSSQDSLPDSPYSSQSLESHPEPSGGDQKRHTRGSLPNLNKRGAGAAGRAATGLAAPGGVGVGGGRKASASATRAPTAAAGSGYGLSRHHTSSDPRLLQQQKGRGSQMQIQPPQRGYSAPRGGDRRTPEYQAGYGQQPRYPGAGAGARPAAGSGLRQPSAVSSAQNPGSRLARPAGTGIPRPGSRLPTFSSRGGVGGMAAMRGIPKPSSGIPSAAGGGGGYGSRSNSATRNQQNRNEWMDECY